jgi:hypothetical protein
MFFPQTPWWDDAKWPVPDGVKYLCERWWELLKDWYCITPYSPPCTYYLSVLEDISEVIDDLQAGRIRTSHQLDALKDELLDLLGTDYLLRTNFGPEVNSTIFYFNTLYTGLPPDPHSRYSEIKKRHVECRRAAMAARRLHHRCTRRRTSQADMTWVGIGGVIGSELMRELAQEPPHFARIERLLVRFLLDCVHRGYNLDYLKTLFDRYLPERTNIHDGLLHAFRRVHSTLRHEYRIYFALRGASAVEARPGEPSIECLKVSEFQASVPASDERERFLEQLSPDQAAIVSLKWSNDPDAGAAADGCRQEIQEIVDYLDFESPTQRFELGPLALVCFADPQGTQHHLVYPDTSGEQPRRLDHTVQIEPEWVDQLKGLSEALRWSAVARRERTPEVSLLASWFAFEFLAGDVEKSAVEGIMEFFPKVIAIGNIRRRLNYWWRCVQATSAFSRHPRRESLTDRASQHGNPRYAGIIQLLTEYASASRSKDAEAITEIVGSSVLLRERTAHESKLFTNNQLIAQTLREESQQIKWDLQRFLVIRNKLVHRATIAHPLLAVVSERSKRLLYDLLRDISAQLTAHRLRNSVAEVLHDYRDTFDELLIELGAGLPSDFVNRFLLS